MQLRKHSKSKSSTAKIHVVGVEFKGQAVMAGPFASAPPPASCWLQVCSIQDQGLSLTGKKL